MSATEKVGTEDRADANGADSQSGVEMSGLEAANKLVKKVDAASASTEGGMDESEPPPQIF